MATAVDESAANAALTKTFDSKATADLEKVTDYEEDKEISPVNIGNAISFVDDTYSKEKAVKNEREKELSKVAIKKEHVDLIMREMEVSKSAAEWSLRSHGGDVVKALISLTN